ncbi:unnamed protein product, partial [Rotaria sordida]
MKARQKWGLL